MGDYSFVKDSGGTVLGIWVADTTMLDQGGLLEALLVKDGHSESPLFEAIVTGQHRIVPNEYDSNGGFFVMVAFHNAPGEVPQADGHYPRG